MTTHIDGNDPKLAEYMKIQFDRLKTELSDLNKYAESKGFSDEDITSIDPALLHYRKADKLVEVPVPDPLASVTEDEVGTIAQLEILERAFTIEIPVNSDGEFDPKSKTMKKFGGLPGTMAGVDKFVNLTPAIEGERAELYAKSIKPAQPTITEPIMQTDQEESWFDKIKGFFGSILNRGQQRK